MSDAESGESPEMDPYLTDDLKVYHEGDQEVLLVREFEDGSGPQTFSIAPDELDKLINRLIKASNDIHRARNGGDS